MNPASRRLPLLLVLFPLLVLAPLACGRSRDEPTKVILVDEPSQSTPATTAEPSKPMTVKVAAVQCSSELGDVEGNRRKLTALVEEAAKEGAKIIVLPETSVTGYLSQDL